jgi:hypothetical protein
MAKAKAAPKAKKQATKAKAKGAAKTDPLHRSLEALGRVKRSVPALSALERQAFESLYDDARCVRMGGRTRSLEVLKEAATVAPQLLATLKAHGPSIRGFSTKRLSHLCDVGVLLGHEIEQQGLAQDGAAQGKQRLARAEAEARTQRTGLHGALSGAVGDSDADERAALDGATGTLASADTLATSLGQLADLGAAWLARTDPLWKFRLHEAGVTAGGVDQAQAAAQALSDAIAGKATSKGGTPGDSEAVNRIEGRLVLELDVAYTALADAHQRDPKVVRLVPGPGTRPALAARKAPATPAPTPAPAPTP